MKRRGSYSWMVLAAVVVGGCSLYPDYWSPKTYPLELERYYQDTGALGPEWKKYLLEGLEDRSFFFARQTLFAVISVSFTCGKYQDIPLPILSEHLIFPMGRKAEVLRANYVNNPRVDVYHVVARGDYCYQDAAVYKVIGPVPRESTEMMIDAYVIGEPHCVVDIVFAADPASYAAALPEFQAYLTSLGVPVDEEESR